MHLPIAFHPKKRHDLRTDFLLAISTTSSLLLSSLYFVLLTIDYIRDGLSYSGFSPLLGGILVLLFLSSYILHKKKYLDLSLTILTTTINTVCTLTGVWWGFDLPTVLLGYTLSIVITGLVASKKENIFHLVFIILMMTTGQILRNTWPIDNTWYSQPFVLTDIIEISIIFTVISLLIVFTNRQQQKLLERAKRTEHILQNERDTLEKRVKEKVAEVKKIQMDHLTTMYRFVEFGKLSSGLFHDLMSPIQTLKLYIESFPVNEKTAEPFKEIQNIQQISTKIESMLETMRKQIRFNQTFETFDLVQDVRDILNITKHTYLKKHIDVSVVSDKNPYTLKTKRVILNHVLLNLITNACEACDENVRNNTVTIYINKVKHPKHQTSISVVDTGVGIKPEDMSRIFENFYSTKKTDSVENGINCGIGLSSSKHAVDEYLGGKLLVESEVGVGTTMTILI